MTTPDHRDVEERLAAVRAVLRPPRLFETTGDLVGVLSKLPADTPLWADEITRAEPGSEDDWALVVTADASVVWSPGGTETAPRLTDPQPAVFIGSRYVHMADVGRPLTSDAPPAALPELAAAALEDGRVGEHLRHVAAYLAGLADDMAKEAPGWFARESAAAEQLVVEARRLEYTAARLRDLAPRAERDDHGDGEPDPQ